MTKWTEPFGNRRRLSWQSGLNKRLISGDAMEQVLTGQPFADVIIDAFRTELCGSRLKRVTTDEEFGCRSSDCGERTTQFMIGNLIA